MSAPRTDIGRYLESCPIQSRANVERFLGKAGNDAASVRKSIGTQFGEIRDLLFVSTVASGLAGSTSDIDIILVVGGDGLADERMSTRIISRGQRLGIMAYTHEEITSAIEHLTALGGLPPARVRGRRDAWDRRERICWTDLERCINGYSFDTSMPYVHGLRALAEASFAIAFEQFRRAVAFAMLAEWAGERRGRYGYAIVAIRELMDAILACHGSVNAGVKWVLERWHRCRPEQADGADGELGGRISAEWRRVMRAADSGCEEPVSTRLLDLYQATKSRHELGIEEDRRPLRWQEGTRLLPFVDGSSIAIGGVPNFSVVEANAMEEFDGFRLRVDPALDVKRARSLLALVRASFADVPLDQTCLGPFHE